MCRWSYCIVLTLLLLLGMVSPGAGQSPRSAVIDYTEISRKLEGGQVKSGEALRLLAESVQSDAVLADLLMEASQTEARRSELVAEAIAYARLGSAIQGSSVELSESPQRLAEAVMRTGPYMRANQRTTANWASETMAALGRLIERLLDRPARQTNRVAAPQGDLNWLIYVAFAILGTVVAGALIFIGMYLYKRIQAKRRTSLIDEFEEERSLDEWLELARGFESRGEYRKAVRAAYIACLLKFDELEVARFMKGQTNWEHLTRIERSPKLAPEVDFRSATKLFDLVWYGHRHAGKEEVARMMASYERIVDSHKVEAPREPVNA